MIVFRLRSKILLAFLIIILSGSILMVTIINFTTRSGYKTFVRQNDIDLCINLQNPLAEFYSFQDSWAGVETFFQFPQQRTGQMRGMMSRSETEGTPLRNMIPQVVLTDANGMVLVNTFFEHGFNERNISKVNLEAGIAIHSGNSVVGYVLAGSMLELGLNENEQRFLDQTTIIIISVSLFILLISIIFSIVFSWKLTRPLSALTKAATVIEEGDFSKRVPVDGNDELSELTNSFNKMAESLENNDLWRKQIIADSAHELRTPVSLIQGNLEMILEGVYKSDKEHIQNIYDETLVLSRLIEELQQLSSAESGSMILDREELDLNSLIENILNIFKAGEVKDHIHVKNSIKAVFPPVEGDYQKLKQVFSNVLANAFRHTPKDGTVEITENVNESSIVIVIEDTGPGIKEEDLEKIFERFYRTDNSRNRNHGGSGLGLAISREILKLHGGSIHAESKKNSGASIFISIPFKK